MTDDSDFEARKKAAYSKLDEALSMLAALHQHPEDDSSVPVDAVLLIGSQWFDEDGDRTGSVIICPRGGWQPGYITSGLIHQAVSHVDGVACRCRPSDDD